MASLCGDGEMWQKTRQPKAGLGQPKGQSEFRKEAWKWGVPVGGTEQVVSQVKWVR